MARRSSAWAVRSRRVAAHSELYDRRSDQVSRVEDLAISVCAVLLAEACNIGLEPLARGDNPALNRNRLSWVQQNYVRAETLTEANAHLVECQTANALAQEWGGGEVASADGMRFVTLVQTVHAGSNRKYFGAGRGITYYNFSTDQYAGFHNIVIPGTLRDSIYILAGLLEQQTSLPKTIHLLTYLDDESYRRRILVQLNRGEGRHAVARNICHGQRGEIRKRYREGQENQLNALGLVTNAVILCNTLYIEAALEQLRGEGLEVRSEDVARLSPLPTSHINVLGRYSFLLAEAVAAGGMRPLRDPNAVDGWPLA